MKYNLKLKENVNADILLNYGFKPKYDVDTGKVIEYYRTLKVDDSKYRHFTFEVVACEKHFWFKHFFYDAWMSMFNWGDVTTKECLELLFSFIKDDIVEIV
jgi:hypothetical protein